MTDGAAATSNASQPSPESGVTVLTAPGERWGWETVDLAKLRRLSPMPRPYFERPPPPDHRAAYTALHLVRTGDDRAFGFGMGCAWFGVLVLSAIIFTGSGFQGPNASVANTTIGVAIVLLPTAILLAILIHRSRRPERIEAGIRAADEGWRRDWEAGEARSGSAMAAWQEQADNYAADETARIGQLPIHGAAQLTSRPRRVDVFGDPAAWRDLLATYGGSVVGSGRDLIVLDFSETEAPATLVALMSVARIESQVVTLPGGMHECDLLGELSPSEIRDILVEALYSDADGVARDQRALSTRALDEALSVLGPTVTMARLWRGLRAMTGQDGPPDPNNPINLAEWTRLSRVFSEDYRVAIGEKLLSLELQLYSLRELGMNVPTNGPRLERSQFECFSISRQGTSLENELLRDLLLQKAIRRLRQDDERLRPFTIVVVGADHLGERHLRRLDEQTAGRPVRLVYLFRELREDSLQIAGSGGAVGFFRLSNTVQAERAADWIGKGYRFVLGQRSVSRGSNYTTTSGGSATTTETVGTARTVTSAASIFGPGSNSRSDNSSQSQADGTTWSTAGTTTEQTTGTQQRVYEHVVQPDTLRSLQDNCLILIEFEKDTGRRRLTAADCSIALALHPRAIAEPFPPDIARALRGPS